MAIDKKDIFSAIVREGTELRSGSDKYNRSYRVVKFRGKTFKLILDEVEA